MTFKDWFPKDKNDWFNQGDQESDRTEPPRLKLPISKPMLILLGILAVTTLIVQASAGFLTDLYWFQARNLSSVLWTRLLPQWGLLAVAFVAAFLALFASLKLARKKAGEIPLPEEISRILPVRAPFAGVLILLASLVLAFMSSNGGETPVGDSPKVPKRDSLWVCGPNFRKGHRILRFQPAFLQTVPGVADAASLPLSGRVSGHIHIDPPPKISDGETDRGP